MSRKGEKKDRPLDLSAASKELLLGLLPLIHEEILEKTTSLMDKFLQEVYMPLLIKRQILLIGDIKRETGEEISRQILVLNANPLFSIDLMIHSTGGDMEAALQICDAISESEARINGIVIGNAHSGAFFILQTCHKRIAHPHATFLLHGPTPVDPIDAKSFESFKKQLNDDHNMILRQIAEKSGQSFIFLKKLSRQNTTLSVSEAKKFGLIDEVVTNLRRR